MTGDTIGSGLEASIHVPPQSKSIRVDSLTSSILDIRKDREDFNLLKGIKDGLRRADKTQKSLPTLLLYDEPGLKLFEMITYLDEYYLTNAEIDVLTRYAAHIAERIQPNSIVLELGSGNLRKIRILLDALEDAGKTVEYYALDVSLKELERTLAVVPLGTFRHVKCLGLHGTYDDGLEWLQSKGVAERPKTIISMGSSIGNFSRDDAASFVRDFGNALRPGDSLLIGIDACKDSEKVFHAYNDKEGVTHNFILNGLTHANEVLGRTAFDLTQWKVIGEYDSINGKHHAFVAPKTDVVIDGVRIKAHERIHFENSFKYDSTDTVRLWEAAGLKEGAKWSVPEGNYGLYMAFKSDFNFSSRPEKYAASPVPSLQDWDSLWAAWDAVTQKMIPKQALLSKPIRLRNACIFYLGHIPTFLAVHLNKATGTEVQGLLEYHDIFERGVDPDVENPELCHDHSEIPDEYPPTENVLAFQTRVRENLREIYASGAIEKSQAVRKAIWISFEHEAMHLETLLYMLVQSEKTNPPPGAILPDFEVMAQEAAAKAKPNQWVDIPAREITLGLADEDQDVITKCYFGWDNEKPVRSTEVPAFTVRARPITNGEYAKYLESTAEGSAKMPASWTEIKSAPNDVTSYANGHVKDATNGIKDTNFLHGKAVRTVFGAVPLKWTLDWPVMASYDELTGFARWSGGRIPSMEEVTSIYEYVDELKGKDTENALGKTIPAVNSHLINDGVEETPPYHSSVNGASSTAASLTPYGLFVNLEDANVGFKHFHPTPVTLNGDKLAGQGGMGGIWEWTSTVLEKHDGFEPMELYPGYTADFFDKKHNIVLGGSWATHPRIAGRKSFVNWYQRNYPYVWAGARLAK